MRCFITSHGTYTKEPSVSPEIHKKKKEDPNSEFREAFMVGKTFTISSHPILRNEIKILDFAHPYELMYEKILGALERTTYQQLRR